MFYLIANRIYLLSLNKIYDRLKASQLVVEVNTNKSCICYYNKGAKKKTERRMYTVS